MNVPTRLGSALLAASFLLPPAWPASAQRRPPPAQGGAPSATPDGPKPIGRFEDWTAATHTESGQTICYAFTYATNSAPALPGRSKPVLTVTERPSGRDSVALSAGFAYPQGADVTMQI